MFLLFVILYLFLILINQYWINAIRNIKLNGLNCYTQKKHDKYKIVILIKWYRIKTNFNEVRILNCKTTFFE